MFFSTPLTALWAHGAQRGQKKIECDRWWDNNIENLVICKTLPKKLINNNRFLGLI